MYEWSYNFFGSRAFWRQVRPVGHGGSIINQESIGLNFNVIYDKKRRKKEKSDKSRYRFIFSSHLIIRHQFTLIIK